MVPMSRGGVTAFEVDIRSPAVGTVVEVSKFMDVVMGVRMVDVVNDEVKGVVGEDGSLAVVVEDEYVDADDSETASKWIAFEEASKMERPAVAEVVASSRCCCIGLAVAPSEGPGGEVTDGGT